MEFDWVEWFGYLASFVILISLTMTSIIKLRWVNLSGCILFAAFAYLIDSVPTIVMNIGIACINLYFLYKIYSTKEEFKIIKASADSEYYQHFLDVNSKDIEKQISLTQLKADYTSFYMLRDNHIAGVLVGENCNGVFDIKLDYVIPQYRDFKLGTYYYHDHPDFFKEKGINTLKSLVNDEAHRLYLEKMGFVVESQTDSHHYIKHL
ncbi:MAG: YgjV family protein [gamma proteobacterium symbiont of Taylorina sp.]|nr:YgjV family protein [gamma proteobacterium symbiont of Taylorina sp.]